MKKNKKIFTSTYQTKKKGWVIKSVGMGVLIMSIITLLCVGTAMLNEYGTVHAKEKDKSQEVLADNQAETDTAANDTAEQGQEKTAVKEDSEPVEITISAAGDCTLGTDENFSSEGSFNSYAEWKGNSYFMENVKSIFEADDLSIVNLEGTLTDSGSRAEKTYAFRGKPSFTSILTEGGIEAVNLANNHSKDYGTESYEDTISNVETAGMISFGYDRTAVTEIKGIRVGLVGIYVLADGMDREAQLKENIAKVKAEGASLVIVSFHWGSEKENYPDSTQKSLAHIAIDNGADLVVGHHPHVLQGIEEYNGKNIVYSLGNFCFGGNSNPGDKDTIIFQQTFTVVGEAVQADNVTNIIPCSISSTSDHNNYQPTPSEGEDKEQILDRIREYSAGLGG